MICMVTALVRFPRSLICCCDSSQDLCWAWPPGQSEISMQHDSFPPSPSSPLPFANAHAHHRPRVASSFPVLLLSFASSFARARRGELPECQCHANASDDYQHQLSRDLHRITCVMGQSPASPATPPLPSPNEAAAHTVTCHLFCCVALQIDSMQPHRPISPEPNRTDSGRISHLLSQSL